MTMYMRELIRLHGDERWDEWGDEWWDHVDRVAELWGAPPVVAPWRFASQPGAIQLDWGAWMIEMWHDELVGSYGPDCELIPPHPKRQTGENWTKRLADLPPGDRYGLVVVEVY